MTDTNSRRTGGGKPLRTEAVGVRLDPKLKYLAELGARIQRRTLSSYIEWAIQASLERTVLTSDPHNAPSISDEASYLWDVDEADRFAKLAMRYPHLLTHEEQVRWKLIRENGAVWKGVFAFPDWAWTWRVSEDALDFELLREHWGAFCRVADTGGSKDELPTWVKTDPSSRPGLRSVDGPSSMPARPRRSSPPTPPKSSPGVADPNEDSRQ